MSPNVYLFNLSTTTINTKMIHLCINNLQSSLSTSNLWTTCRMQGRDFPWNKNHSHNFNRLRRNSKFVNRPFHQPNPWDCYPSGISNYQPKSCPRNRLIKKLQYNKSSSSLCHWMRKSIFQKISCKTTSSKRKTKSLKTIRSKIPGKSTSDLSGRWLTGPQTTSKRKS